MHTEGVNLIQIKLSFVVGVGGNAVGRGGGFYGNSRGSGLRVMYQGRLQ